MAFDTARAVACAARIFADAGSVGRSFVAGFERGFVGLHLDLQGFRVCLTIRKWYSRAMSHCIGCKEGTRGKRGVLELQERDDALLHAIGRLLGQDEFGTAKNMGAAPAASDETCADRGAKGGRR